MREDWIEINMGKIAETCWLEIPQHFPFVELGDHVIMPNHMHGIIIINKPDDGRDGEPVNDAGTIGGRTIDGGTTVETQNFASLRQPTHNPQPPVLEPSRNRFGPQSQNLASTIRGYKTGVTKQARLLDKNFKNQGADT